MLLPRLEHPGDRRHRAPVARGRGHAEQPIELREVANGSHLAAVDAKDEAAFCPTIFRPQAPAAGNCNGSGEAGLRSFASTLTNETTSAPDAWPASGFNETRRSTSRPLQIMTCVSNGSCRASWARRIAWLPGFRTTNVPAAPTFTTSKRRSCCTSALGRKTLCPPTLTPLRKTTSAMNRYVVLPGSSYKPNSVPAGSANTANAPMPGPISVRGFTTRPPAL